MSYGSDKDPFEKLDDDEKDTFANMDSDELVARIAKVSMDQVELEKAKDEDQDLAEKQEAANEAGAVYRDGTKMNKLRIRFMKRCLEDKGFSKAQMEAIESRRKHGRDEL